MLTGFTKTMGAIGDDTGNGISEPRSIAVEIRTVRILGRILRARILPCYSGSARRVALVADAADAVLAEGLAGCQFAVGLEDPLLGDGPGRIGQGDDVVIGILQEVEDGVGLTRRSRGGKLGDELIDVAGAIDVFPLSPEGLDRRQGDGLQQEAQQIALTLTERHGGHLEPRPVGILVAVADGLDPAHAVVVVVLGLVVGLDQRPMLLDQAAKGVVLVAQDQVAQQARDNPPVAVEYDTARHVHLEQAVKRVVLIDEEPVGRWPLRYPSMGPVAGQVVVVLVAVNRLADGIGEVQVGNAAEAVQAGVCRAVVEREARGITGGLLRLSVGIEDPDDLVADLDTAFATAAKPGATSKAAS